MLTAIYKEFPQINILQKHGKKQMTKTGNDYEQIIQRWNEIANKHIKNTHPHWNYVKYRLKINHHQIEKNVKRWIISSVGKDMEKREIM